MRVATTLQNSRDYKKKTSAQFLWSLLLAAAARITALSDACQRLDEAPSDETARKALMATLPNYATLQRQFNAALAGHLPKALRKRLQRLAIDLTLIPYHGKPLRDPEEIYRGPAKDGTSHFHAYATAYVVRHGQRYTVALTGVKKSEPPQGGGPTPAPSSRERRRPAPLAPAGSRVLQRGRSSLPAGGALSIPDAGGRPRPLAPAAWRSQRQLRLPDLEEERLVHLHAGRREEVHRDGVDLREVPQLSGSVEAAQSAGADLCLLGVSAVVAGFGVRDVSTAVRDRDELS